MTGELFGPANRPLFQPGAHEGPRKITVPPVVVGIPPGGLTDEWLIKLSDADYDVGWGIPDCLQPPVVDPILVDDYSAPSLLAADSSTIEGSTLFVCSFSNDRVVSIDISDPTNLVELQSLPNFPQLDFPNRIISSGTVAYVATIGNGGGWARVTSIDITNPSTMSILHSVLVDGNNVGSGADLDFLGSSHIAAIRSHSGARGMAVVDRSNPSALSVVGLVDLGLNQSNHICTVGDFAYVWGRWISPLFRTRLTAVDCTTRSAPTGVGFHEFTVSTPTTGELLNFDGYVVFVGQGGLWIFDVSTPGSPTLVAQTAFTDLQGSIISAKRVSGLPIIVATSLSSDSVVWIDMTDPLNPAHLATIVPPSVAPTGNLIGPAFASSTATHAFVSLRNTRVVAYQHYQ